MNDQASKNIIITILIVLVLGLIAVIYVSKSDNNSFSIGENQEQTVVLPSSNQTSKEEQTSLPVPAVTSPPQIDVSQVDFNQSVAIITYTDSGFIPPVVEVVAGNSVTFINSSNKPLWVTSQQHPTAKAQYYPGFNQGKSVSNGGTYTFNFTKVGVWGYKNLNFEKHLGAISVIPQQ